MNDKQVYCIEVCKSECCKRFTLPESYTTLKKAYNKWRKSETDESQFEDIDLIFPMLLPLDEGKVQKAADYSKFYTYKCKHLVEGKCSIYTIRPKMCRGFGTKYIPTSLDKKCIYNKKGVNYHGKMGKSTNT